MRRPLPLLLLAAVIAALLPFGGPSAASATSDTAAEPRFKALVFSKINGFDHESRPYGVAALQKLATENNFEVVASDDAAAIVVADPASPPPLAFDHARILADYVARHRAACDR